VCVSDCQLPKRLFSTELVKKSVAELVISMYLLLSVLPSVYLTCFFLWSA
jgi:hypothetical protein